MTKQQQEVAHIIEDYCEGKTHLEFHVDDLEEMTNRILEYVTHDT